MGTRSIYVVDDDDDVRTSLQALLSTIPNTLIWGFRSGDLFLSRAEELDPGCVILDFHMPGSTGLDVLEALAARRERFVAIVITGHADVALAIRAMKAGAFDFLEKPYDYPSLLEIIRLAFERLEQSGARTASIAEAKRKIGLLSPRERDVLNGLLDGRSNKVIAHDLNLSPRTIEIYRANMMEKLEVTSLSATLRIAFTAEMPAREGGAQAKS